MKQIIIGILALLLGITGCLAEEISDTSDTASTNTVIEGYLPYKAKKGEVIYSSSQYRISKVDPTSKTNAEGKNMPGARGTNQLIIYTPQYGNSTETNEYGNEAIVVGNTVVELSGADSPIPKDGFVISGHGKAKNWINNAIKIGTKVYVNFEENTIYTYMTSESYIYLAEKKLEETEQMMQYYAQNNPNFNSKYSHIYINDAKKYIKKAKKQGLSVKKNVALAIEASNDALKSTIPYNPKEMKGVWIRPVETTPDEIKNTVKNIKRLGFNTIFLETFYHGRTIYPSKLMSEYGFIEQNEIFAGFDPLRIWRDECQKEGIKLHIWFETFYIGPETPKTNPQNILSVNPYWSIRNKKETDSDIPVKVTTEHNGYFLDPMNSEVQAFLTGILTEIIEEYKPDGINLDYIRFPQSVSEMNLWGYSEIARTEFLKQYGIDPVNAAGETELTNWANFRRAKITEMVNSVHDLCKKKNVYLSVVIFPDRLKALTTKLQDWKSWSQDGLIDGVTPLFLTCDDKTASNQIYKVEKVISPKTDLFAGVFVTFIGGSADDLIRQIHSSRKLETGGVVIFDYAHVSNKYDDAISMFFNPKPKCNTPKKEKNAAEKTKLVTNDENENLNFGGWFKNLFRRNKDLKTF